MSKILNLKSDLPDLDEGNFLILINPEKIPHMVYLQDGRYYSLTFKGIELAFSFPAYLERLFKARKKMIFLELQAHGKSPFQVFSEYVNAGDNEHTCLDPIKDLLRPGSPAELIFELIPELYANGQILSAAQVGMDDLLDENGDFEMNQYTKDDVQKYITDLRTKYVERG